MADAAADVGMPSQKKRVISTAVESSSDSEADTSKLDEGQMLFLKALGKQQKAMVKPLSKKVDALTADVQTINTKQTKAEGDMTAMKTEFDAMKKRLEVVESGDSKAAGGSDGSTSAGRGSSTDFAPTKRPPIGQRNVVCVGGYRLCEGDEIITHLNTLKDTYSGIKKVISIGSYATRGKIIFVDSNHMWAFMVAMKGKKLSSPLADPERPQDPSISDNRLLWHSIDKFPEELAMGTKCNHAKFLLTTYLNTEFPDIATIQDSIDAGRDGGSVVLCAKEIPALQSTVPVKLYQRMGQAHVLSVSRGAQEKLASMNITFNLEEHLGEINDPPRR